MMDPRLLGAWRSDADRTIARIRRGKELDEPQVAALRRLYGKLRLTYAATTLTTDFDGTIETYDCRTLGTDAVSAAIQIIPRQPPPALMPVVSSFAVIRFESRNVYSVQPELSEHREYFRRIGTSRKRRRGIGGEGGEPGDP